MTDELSLQSPSQPPQHLTVIPITPVRYDLGYGGLYILHTQNRYSDYSTDPDVSSIRDSVTLELWSDADGMISRRYTDPIETPAEACLMFQDVITRLLGDAQAVWLYTRLNELPPWERVRRSRDISFLRHTFDDEGNANRFEDECRGWLIYDRPSAQWYAWTGNHYEPAQDKLIRAARFIGRSVADEDEFWKSNEEKYKAFKVHSQRAAGYVGQSHMLKLAEGTMSVDLSKQSDLTLMACRNGLINRRTGEFIPLWNCGQYKDRYPTVYVDCEYHPNMVPTEWIKHISLVMTDNTSDLPEDEIIIRRDNLTEYLHRLFGYALYAGNPERLFVFFWGKTTNGKSTTINVLSEVFGEQASNPPLTQLYSSDRDIPTPAIVDALPKSLAFFSEASGDTNSAISVASFKEISGDAYTTKFRKMHQNNIKLPIMCLPIGITNDLPSFDRADDAAVLKRMVTIPFRHVFTEENREVAHILVQERDAIFSMCVNELRKYLAEGLPDLHPCARATQQELLIGSALYTFIRTQLKPVENPTADAKWISRRDLKEKYILWCQENQIDEVVIRYRFDGEMRIPELSRVDTTKLYSAMKVMGIPEVHYWKNNSRHFKAIFRTSAQDTLI